MMENQLVWVRDPSGGYIHAKIVEIGTQDFEVVPVDQYRGKRTVLIEDTFPSCEGPQDHDDNCELMFLNEATLLENLKNRYFKDKIYTFVANVLIAVNPYREINGLYSFDAMRKYNGRSLGELPPHVFAIAEKAIRDMRVLKESQSIIVSGESGAGKTESTKYILKYLCHSNHNAGPIEQNILDANPVLEAFGNAKTTRNNNSSRFGKFVEVHYDRKYQVVGGFISHYLLEKSRICTQSADERNYHIFYMFLAGAWPELRNKFKLGNPDDYRYLNGCTQYFAGTDTNKVIPITNKSAVHIKNGPLADPIVDDFKNFQILDKSLLRMGLTEELKMQIYTLVAAVLHLGNISFEEITDDIRGGCQVSRASEEALQITSNMLCVDPGELRQALVSRVMQSKGGGYKGTIIMVPLKTYEANNARDALAKSIYSRLFDKIVSLVNNNIPWKAAGFYIGVLDIAGFEYFALNSFEQFCINYCNEKLQKFFNDRILQHEQELYKREGLNVPEIKYADNQDILELIESKPNGIFCILDEESKLPKPSAPHFTSEVHKTWTGHFRLALPRSSRLKTHRTIRDDEGFLIRHFAGAVCYNTSQFIEKNNDALHGSLEGLVQESGNSLLKSIFSAGSAGSKGKLNFISVGSKFKTQLAELMNKLQNNGTCFIRCIKPNSKMLYHDFDDGLALAQLKSSGTTSVLELMEHGYPSRVQFTEIYNMYKSYLPPELVKLQPRTLCEAILQSLKFNNHDFKFGITRVFFRPGMFMEFDSIMKSNPENLRDIVSKVKKWLLRSRWLKLMLGAIAVIKLKNHMQYKNKCVLVIQKTLRGHLARKQHQHRIKGVCKILNIRNDLGDIAKRVKIDKEAVVKEVNAIESKIDEAVTLIKAKPDIQSTEIDNLYKNILDSVKSLTVDLNKRWQDHLQAKEQEHLEKLRIAFEIEKKCKEEEDLRKREQEETKKLKAEMEAKRKFLESEIKIKEEADPSASLILKAQLEDERQAICAYWLQLEQDRRDHELALRLAEESNDQVEDHPPSMRRSEVKNVQQPTIGNQKQDLSKWKYSELRDAINTSCDIELLEACRHEFHRRLKVYHAWKAKNRKRTTDDEKERAPQFVMEAAAKATPRISFNQESNSSGHRYFRIPFTRAKSQVSGTKGLWYAHFDGQYISRQMELHPGKPPILLVAGLNDMQMCELSLEETGLTRKRGAEILEHEFNREWERNGGNSYRYIRQLD